MNYFKKHLNLTWILALCVTIAIMLVGDPNSQAWVYAYIFSAIAVYVIGGWVITQKRRSLWWILLVGWLSPLWLGNNSEKPS